MAGYSGTWDANTPSFSSSRPQIPHSARNVFCLLARREISPRAKCSPKWQWGEVSKQNMRSSLWPKGAARDARHGLFSWAEAVSLHQLSAKYCPLVPPPRSTIAVAFSSNGKTVASTHGDHTVKIIECQTGRCLKVLSGHRRTPWVVRFHPGHPEIVASGSLDHEVRLWDVKTAECIGSRDFYRPIASIAFHAEGEILAVASGHKLYIWPYNRKGEASSPIIVLKTRRSMRAVHFHPCGAPFLLTAEVNDLDSSDSLMIRATSPGCSQYPPPSLYVANARSSCLLNFAAEFPLMQLTSLYLPSFARDDLRMDMQHQNKNIDSSSMNVETVASMQHQTHANSAEQYDHMASAVGRSPAVPSTSNAAIEEYYALETKSSICDTRRDVAETTGVQLVDGCQPPISQSVRLSGPSPCPQDRASVMFRGHQFLRPRDPMCWGIPFLQGCLVDHSEAGLPLILPFNDGTYENSSEHLGVGSAMLTSDLPSCNEVAAMAPLSTRSDINQFTIFERPGSCEFRQGAASINTLHNGSDSFHIISRIQSELAASLAATEATELPCTVKLRIWQHDIKSPDAPLVAEKCRLIIPHAVLCSEMGAHFSPCGRFLAACVACVLPQIEADPGMLSQMQQDVAGAAISPTRHPISARQVIYELRIYSLEEATFGSVLVSRAIRAAHCLTSIQFSPTSEHILLAYGRRHSSLLKSIVVSGETSVPIYTVLEVYRVSDMMLVSVLPSAEDEVNVACFHPLAGGGLVYGTKEGKLRVLQYDGAHGMNFNVPGFFRDKDTAEEPLFACFGADLGC